MRVQPRAAPDEIVGPVGNRLKVRIGSAPVDGEANRALVRFLAKRFRVARSRVTIVAGNSSRDKLVEIDSPAKIPHEVLGYIG